MAKKSLSFVAPPIGIQPEWAWREERSRELLAAIERYEDAEMGDKSCVLSWRRELSEHHLFHYRREERQEETS